MKLQIDRKAEELHRSLPARGAWIEIATCLAQLKRVPVAPHEGSVD